MLFETIAKIIVERTGRDISEVKPESTFTELGIDSLDTVELLMSLEDEIGTEIELDEKVETVGDLVKFVESKIQKQVSQRIGIRSHAKGKAERLIRKFRGKL